MKVIIAYDGSVYADTAIADAISVLSMSPRFCDYRLVERCRAVITGSRGDVVQYCLTLAMLRS